jgi:hopanoid-associated phosphorylase
MNAANSGECGAGPVIAVCGLAFEAAIAAGPGVVTLCGGNPDRLEARLQRLLEQEARQCRGIISFGTAGGLHPALRPGACVIADTIMIRAERVSVDPDWLRALRSCLPDATGGTLAGVNQPVLDAADKLRMWQSSGACAVDMESHRAALIAQRHDVPFAVCRVVIDPAHRSVPPIATAGLRDDGTTALLQMVGALAVRPGQLPALLRLALDAAAARRSLRAIRSRLGEAFALPLPPW